MMGTAIDWFRALGGSIAPELATLPPGESPAVAIRHSAPREWPTLAPDTISRQDGPSRSGRREFSASSCRGSRRRPAPPPHPATSSSKSCLLSNCGTLCPATSGARRSRTRRETSRLTFPRTSASQLGQRFEGDHLPANSAPQRRSWPHRGLPRPNDGTRRSRGGRQVTDALRGSAAASRDAKPSKISRLRRPLSPLGRGSTRSAARWRSDGWIRSDANSSMSR